MPTPNSHKAERMTMTQQLQYRADRTIARDGVPLARCYANRDEAFYGPLFAAAPDLLAALQAVADSRSVSGLGKLLSEQIRAALARAGAA